MQEYGSRNIRLSPRWQFLDAITLRQLAGIQGGCYALRLEQRLASQPRHYVVKDREEAAECDEPNESLGWADSGERNDEYGEHESLPTHVAHHLMTRASAF